MSDYHPEGVSESDAASYVEEEFAEWQRETAQAKRDRLEDLSDVLPPDVLARLARRNRKAA